jgi:hypothetical protein
MREFHVYGGASSKDWCVQQEINPAGVRVRRPVVWIAGRRETKVLKPIDKISLGEITSRRAVTKVNAELASKM